MADSQSITGSGSTGEEESDEESESGSEEEEEFSSSEEEEEEEPLLKYLRFGAGLGFGEEIAGDSRMISCMAIHYRVSWLNELVLLLKTFNGIIAVYCIRNARRYHFLLRPAGKQISWEGFFNCKSVSIAKVAIGRFSLIVYTTYFLQLLHHIMYVNALLHTVSIVTCKSFILACSFCQSNLY